MITRFVGWISIGMAAGLFGCGGTTLSTTRAAGPGTPPISFATQTVKEENAEGPDVERTIFAAGTKRIVYGLPKGCRLTPEGSSVLIDISGTGLNGQIRISNSNFPTDLELTANALKYRAAASEMVPKGATHVEVRQPELNTYPYNGWKSIGFTWTYEFYGRSLLQTVSYINLEFGRQVVVYTQADQADAEKVSKVARQFMSSWWVMKENSDG